MTFVSADRTCCCSGGYNGAALRGSLANGERLSGQAGMKRVEANIMSRVKKGKMKEAAAKAALGKLTGTLTYDDFGSVDMVRVTFGNAF